MELDQLGATSDPAALLGISITLFGWPYSATLLH